MLICVIFTPVDTSHIFYSMLINDKSYRTIVHEKGLEIILNEVAESTEKW